MERIFNLIKAVVFVLGLCLIFFKADFFFTYINEFFFGDNYNDNLIYKIHPILISFGILFLIIKIIGGVEQISSSKIKPPMGQTKV